MTQQTLDRLDQFFEQLSGVMISIVIAVSSAYSCLAMYSYSVLAA